jgi:phage recombination protein Bet
MNNLAILENKSISIWEGQENLKQIKTIFAPKLNDLEFTVFVEMGKATGLNPFLKEIWAVKYDEKSPAQIFIGRDGYRKSAQRSPFYDYHSADAVYSGDEFYVVDGEIKHKYTLTNRGNLVGAYCIAQRKGSSRPSYVYVSENEYNKKFSVWKEKPSTMIKKVAEAQCLKMAFQELFSGSYSEYEAWDKQKNQIIDVEANIKSKLITMAEDKSINTDFSEVTGEILSENIDKIESNQCNGFNFDSIKLKIEKAKNVEELIEAVDLVNSLPNMRDKKELMKIYRSKQAEL